MVQDSSLRIAAVFAAVAAVAAADVAAPAVSAVEAAAASAAAAPNEAPEKLFLAFPPLLAVQGHSRRTALTQKHFATKRRLVA